MKFKKLVLASLLALSITPVAFAETVDEQFQRAVITEKQGNYETSFKLYSELAEQGIAAAQYNLGVLYRKGGGIRQDYQQSFKWTQKAAEQGLSEAQYDLGLMYIKGDGIKQDYQQALRWTQKAAEQGYAKAQNNLV